MAESKRTILLVDDEPANLDFLDRTFRNGYATVRASNANDALAVLRTQHVDMIITDQRMPGISGIDFLKESLVIQPRAHKIVLSGYTDTTDILSAINEVRIKHYLVKPITSDRLLEVVESAFDIDTANTMLSHVRRAFDAAVGRANVIGSAEVLRQVETATFPTDQKIPLIVRPQSREHVQGCVRIANEFGLPIYPISGGTNWGYGSRVPNRDGAIMLDLSSMNRILAYDEELAYVTVEAGVSQRKLDEFLRARGSKLWIDPTSLCADSCIVGNISDRGHGLTPYADHVATACGFEVVLPNGECIDTGYGGYRGCTVSALDKWGVGPSLDGLFTQSGFGIITKLTVWLMPAPEKFLLAVWPMDTDDAMERTVEVLRPLRLSGLLKTGPRWINEYRMLQSTVPYPWERTGGTSPVSQELALELAHGAGFSRWTGFLGLYGHAREVELQREEVASALNKLGLEPEFLDEERIESGTGRWQQPPVKGTFRGMIGKIPPERPFPRLYWRHRNPTPTGDYDQDQCGVLWVTAVSPLSGKHLRAVSTMTRETMLRHGFEPDLCADNMRERVLHYHISITYDRRVRDDDDRAVACHRELMGRLIEAGYPPQRLPNNAMQYSERHQTEYLQLVQRLRSALDPRGVLSPGRYGA